MTLTDLRAARAMREEDYRIAAKHRDEAAARVMTRENKRAYDGAQAWAEECYERMCDARGAVIRHLAGMTTTDLSALSTSATRERSNA